MEASRSHPLLITRCAGNTATRLNLAQVEKKCGPEILLLANLLMFPGWQEGKQRNKQCRAQATGDLTLRAEMRASSRHCHCGQYPLPSAKTEQRCLCSPFFWPQGVVLTSCHEESKKKRPKKEAEPPAERLCSEKSAPAPGWGFLQGLYVSQRDELVCSSSTPELCWGRQQRRPWEVVWIILVMLTIT